MKDKTIQSMYNFHLAGIVPVAGEKLDFDFPWHDCMQPVGKNYLAIEHSVLECVYAGCETIWIVCHDETQPLIRYRLGEYVKDMTNSFMGQPIPIYYVPIHPKDRNKRDCLGWSVLYGASTAYWLSKSLTQWVSPDRYYVSFPYGVYDLEPIKKMRKQISSFKPFYISHNGDTVKNDQYLGFTFNASDFKSCRQIIRKEGTGIHTGYNNVTLPVDQRWSARYFDLEKVFAPVDDANANILNVSWYYPIDSWDGLCQYLASEEKEGIKKPPETILKYRETNPTGVNENDC